MALSHKNCRICLNESEFNVSLFGSYCRRTNMVDKILVCLKLVIEEADRMDTICFKCAENIERYHDFIMYVRKCQMKLSKRRQQPDTSVGRRQVFSFVREQFVERDLTYSFTYSAEEKKPEQSNPFFSNFSPPDVVKKPSEPAWKTPLVEKRDKHYDKFTNVHKEPKKRQISRDLFESQSQEAEDPKPLEWTLTPGNILERIRYQCFGRSD